MLHTKADLIADSVEKEGITVSTVLPDGLDDLLDWLEREVQSDLVISNEAVLTRLRHRDFLSTALHTLEQSLDKKLPLELRSECLRLAADSLGRVTGRIDVEDLLDVIFSEFCVGK